MKKKMDNKEYTTKHDHIVMQAEPAHRAAAVSYMLKGEVCTILLDDNETEFVQVALKHDWYKGYVLRWQLQLFDAMRPINQEDVFDGFYRTTIVKAMQKYIEGPTPYLRWGRMTTGIDCSWLTQAIYKKCGVPIGRDVSDQIIQGREIDFTDMEMWDLMFFRDSKGDNHVWMFMEPWKVLHASQVWSADVRVDSFDQDGIKDADWRRTHVFLSARRYVER
jgi:hypothetical protein